MLIKLPYPPSLNRIWRNDGKGRTYKPGPVVAWANQAAWLVKAAMGSAKPLDGPVAVKIVAHRPDKRRRDVANLEKVVSDALQAGGLVVDDCQIRVAIRWADDPWEWSLSGVGYVQFPHVVTVELGEPK